MTRRQLDLSHALIPLENEFKETLEEICLLKSQDSPLFDSAIENFISKYGNNGYRSLDDLLASSAAQANLRQQEPVSLDSIIKDLLA